MQVHNISKSENTACLQRGGPRGNPTLHKEGKKRCACVRKWAAFYYQLRGPPLSEILYPSLLHYISIYEHTFLRLCRVCLMKNLSLPSHPALSKESVLDVKSMLMYEGAGQGHRYERFILKGLGVVFVDQLKTVQTRLSMEDSFLKAVGWSL